jgi:cytochrome P450
MMAYVTATIGTTAAVLAVVWYLLAPKYNKHEPKPVPHWIPVLGHALTLGSNKRTEFFDNLSKERNGEPFSILIASRKHYIFHKPSAYATLMKFDKVLTHRSFVSMALINWFGHPPAAAHRISTEWKPRFHALNNDTLVRPDALQPVTAQYHKGLAEALTEMQHEAKRQPAQEIVTTLLELIVTLMVNPSTDAFFGKNLRKMHPDVIEDLLIMAREGFWPMMRGSPRFLYPRPYAARDRLVAAFAQTVERIHKNPDADGASPAVVERMKIGEDAGGRETAAREILSVLWGLQTNSVPTAYCTLLRLAENKALVARLRQELVEAGLPTLEPAQWNTVVPERTPHLRAFGQEVIRFHSAQATIRELLEDISVEIDGQYWELKKGGVLNMPSSLLSMDPTVHADPQRFDPERFLDKGLGGKGVSYLKTVKNFGAGSSYCPGRIFAEHQILGLAAVIIQNFDLDVVSRVYNIPSVADESVLERPSIDIKLTLRA